MKKLVFIALIAMLLTSCMSNSYYYQVYKAIPTSEILLKENLLVYEDANCKISYNLWDDGGNIGFMFFNKTDTNIYLNLVESFFILNNVSLNYYRNRVFTNSTSSGTSSSNNVNVSKSITGTNYADLLQTNKVSATNATGIMTSAGYSVSYNEEKIVCIPSNTCKIITEYNISESLFRDCDLLRYPNKKEIKKMTFTKSESPLVFSNRIAYSIGQQDKTIIIENEFYATEISNYPENEMIEFKYDKLCGQASQVKMGFFKSVSPDMFYIRYSKDNTSWNWDH